MTRVGVVDLAGAERAARADELVAGRDDRHARAGARSARAARPAIDGDADARRGRARVPAAQHGRAGGACPRRRGGRCCPAATSSRRGSPCRRRSSAIARRARPRRRRRARPRRWRSASPRPSPTRRGRRRARARLADDRAASPGRAGARRRSRPSRCWRTAGTSCRGDDVLGEHAAERVGRPRPPRRAAAHGGRARARGPRRSSAASAIGAHHADSVVRGWSGPGDARPGPTAPPRPGRPTCRRRSWPTAPAVAHGWLVRLIAAAPLDARAGTCPSRPWPPRARPVRGAAVLAAVGSDACARRHARAGRRRGPAAGAGDARRRRSAAGALRDACGAALEAGVPRADAARAAALAARLAHVGDVLVQAVLRAPAEALAARVGARPAAGAPFALLAVEVEDAARLLGGRPRRRGRGGRGRRAEGDGGRRRPGRGPDRADRRPAVGPDGGGRASARGPAGRAPRATPRRSTGPRRPPAPGSRRGRTTPRTPRRCSRAPTGACSPRGPPASRTRLTATSATARRPPARRALRQLRADAAGRRGRRRGGRRSRRRAAAPAGDTPIVDVCRKPSRLAAAAVRSYDAPCAKGPRSTTGTVSVRPRKSSSTGVPQRRRLCATPSSVRVSRCPQAVRRPKRPGAVPGGARRAEDRHLRGRRRGGRLDAAHDGAQRVARPARPCASARRRRRRRRWPRARRAPTGRAPAAAGSRPPARRRRRRGRRCAACGPGARPARRSARGPRGRPAPARRGSRRGEHGEDDQGQGTGNGTRDGRLCGCGLRGELSGSRACATGQRRRFAPAGRGGPQWFPRPPRDGRAEARQTTRTVPRDPVGLRADQGRGMRRSAERTACWPTAAPSWATSPTACSAVVTSAPVPGRPPPSPSCPGPVA